MRQTRGHHGLLGRRWIVALAVCALLSTPGCHSGDLSKSCCFYRIPRPQQRSVEELYFEALASQRPEVTLGMHHAQSTEANVDFLDTPPTSIPTESNPEITPQALPTGVPEGTAIPMTPPAGIAQSPPPVETRSPSQIPIRKVLHTPLLSGKSPIVTAEASSEKRVGSVFLETDVRDAVQELANQAGVAIVLDDTVRGDITCTIENEPFEQALERVLLPLGMVYRKKGNLYLIGSNDPSSNLFAHIAESMEYRPNHLSAQELISLLPPRQSQFVRMVEKRNLIMIEAPQETARHIFEQLESADQPIPQIMIEAVICVVAPEKGLQFGVDWNHVLRIQGLDALNVGISGLSFTGAMSPYGASNAFDDFAVTSAFIKLLAKEGYVTIRAAPRVMAKDGEKAEISIARETFFSIQQANSQFLFNQNIQTVESGIRLMLTPVIRGDTVQIQIEKAEVSEDIRSIDPQQQLNNSPYPIINRRNVATTVQVKDRQTIVIGGLVGRQEVNRESRVPVLGDIPFLGALFRKVEQQEQDAEVAIFISPQIVLPTAIQDHTPVCPPETSPGELPPPALDVVPPASPEPLPLSVPTTSVIPQLRAVPVL